MNIRWYTTPLDCLRCVVEDYLIEWFIDTFQLASHSCRVTTLKRDMAALKMLRCRFDKLVHPVDFSDEQIKEILLVSLARKSTIVKIEEIIEDDIHAKTTRGNEHIKDLLRLTKESKGKIVANVRDRGKSGKKVSKIVALNEINKEQAWISFNHK